MRTKFIAYDWFKLIVLLFLILLLLMFKSCMGQSDTLLAVSPFEKTEVAADLNKENSSDNFPDSTEMDEIKETSGSSHGDESKVGSEDGSEQEIIGHSDSSSDADGLESPQSNQQVDGASGASESSTIDESQTQVGDENGQEATALSGLCPKALPARLAGSEIKASVVNADIPLRSSPEVAGNIIYIMPIGTQITTVSEMPVCTEYLSGANNWWKIQTSDGSIGFAAEGSAINATYYLEEVREP